MSLAEHQIEVKQQDIFRNEYCRGCESPKLETFLNLGQMPAPNRFLNRAELDQAEPFYPLTVELCNECNLVQLGHVVNPEILFANYVYSPAASKTMIRHFDGLAQIAVARSEAQPNDLVVVPGSNDGTQLKPFSRLGLRVLGVDPAKNLAEIANSEGLNTQVSLFTEEEAKNIKDQHGSAKLITATNVVAHVHDLKDFFKGVTTLLDKDGMFISEFPYLPDLIKKLEFDTIYHEHLTHFALAPYQRLLATHGLTIVDVEKLEVHGGSIRVFAKPGDRQPSGEVESLIATEGAQGLNNISTYQRFSKDVYQVGRDLRSLLESLQDRNYTVAGYGASAKGNILTNFCRLGPEILSGIYDSTPYKQGKFTPGMHLPVLSEGSLLENQPEFSVLFAWNFAEEIISKQREYRKRGGQFIIPIPVPSVVKYVESNGKDSY